MITRIDYFYEALSPQLQFWRLPALEFRSCHFMFIAVECLFLLRSDVSKILFRIVKKIKFMLVITEALL